ncbi:EF-hand domain-containing protein [Roseibium sp. MMSF_3544]|uniref:EF-hand domain-containing protein n=1 Tax=unclassified Roseibium TaxID=2629323 RepID=UPI00273DED4E|nr:EF-hand domain-containing protein [Roseibium sp. MMSF_3544]
MHKEKKSETLEVRLSHREKTAFASRSAERGESMSAALRRMIADYAMQRSKPKEVSMWKKVTLMIAPVAAIAALAAAMSLVDAEARVDFKGNFQAKDANGDGFVDRQEMIAVMTKRAAQVDLPDVCDGTELARKWTFSPEILADGEIEFADGNADGRLTLQEVIAAVERKRAADFVGADVDSNGYVTVSELAEAYRKDEVNISAECRAAIDMQGAAKAPEIVAYLDRDGDELVSLREFVDH